jgi:hypothetical protein
MERHGELSFSEGIHATPSLNQEIKDRRRWSLQCSVLSEQYCSRVARRHWRGIAASQVRMMASTPRERFTAGPLAVISGERFGAGFSAWESVRCPPRCAARTMSVFVQVFGRRHDDPFHALWRPASKKRQGTKSREVDHWRDNGRYGDLMAAPSWRVDVTPTGCGRRICTLTRLEA